MYDSESSSEAGWIEWFCDLEGHEFFVAVSHNTFPPPQWQGHLPSAAVGEALISMANVLTLELPL